MQYCIVVDGKIENVIECENADAASLFGGKASYDGAIVGGYYVDPKIRAEKEAEISAACHAAIVAGTDVETTRGTEHFDLTETDQINLTTALGKVKAGAVAYPYHSKGSLCRMFTADEIKAVSQAAEAHAMYHQTLCNHLLTWARRAETQEDLERITYTAEGLPEDLAANMAQVLAETAATGDLTDKEVSA